MHMEWDRQMAAGCNDLFLNCMRLLKSKSCMCANFSNSSVFHAVFFLQKRHIFHFTRLQEIHLLLAKPLTLNSTGNWILSYCESNP